MTCEIALVAEPDAALKAIIHDGLRDYNFATVSPGEVITDLAVAIRSEEGAVLGGLWGRTARGWLSIELIFVPESLRGQGIASRLIACAEEEALRRGCHSAWLETLNVHAASLYERLGFAVFGELQNFAPGIPRTFLQKRLTPQP
ncbi:GNAT family N-acetyltransferase [Microvirga antarctica]|uniref:GNAT family N-acetyltransferase n=1 Tax=Microvirga antarctica TaxID=2819233 RepID=UPI001B305BB0|nr:GNAT family N-acetyltransferase [Microvirga antarctica]